MAGFVLLCFKTCSLRKTRGHFRFVAMVSLQDKLRRIATGKKRKKKKKKCKKIRLCAKSKSDFIIGCQLWLTVNFKIFSGWLT